MKKRDIHCDKRNIIFVSGLNYMQKSSKKSILKYKQKLTNSTLFNTFIPKIPFLLNLTIMLTSNKQFIGLSIFQGKIPEATPMN
jgi:hypothetical protein